MDLPLPPDFKEFLLLLNSGKIEYLIVGGYAVSREDLIANKLAASRPKDRNGLKHLRVGS